MTSLTILTILNRFGKTSANSAATTTISPMSSSSSSSRVFYLVCGTPLPKHIWELRTILIVMIPNEMYHHKNFSASLSLNTSNDILTLVTITQMLLKHLILAQTATGKANKRGKLPSSHVLLPLPHTPPPNLRVGYAKLQITKQITVSDGTVSCANSVTSSVIPTSIAGINTMIKDHQTSKEVIILNAPRPNRQTKHR